MKNYIQNLAMLSAVITFGCNQRRQEPIEQEVKPEQTETQAVGDSVTDSGENISLTKKTIEGIVQEIQNGKDGYTAKIETDNKEIYFATISIANLSYHEQFRRLKVGEKINITGDFWKMENENHITVRTLEDRK